MSPKFKLSAVSTAVLASLFAMPVIAQEDADATAKDKENAEEIEVIEVKGFRGSLRKAVNAKRFADTVRDSIHAEDVGKSTDQNIADALSRVTGVSVQEDGGEGARISVRGTGPSMNQIQMNGVALTSGLSGDQGDDPTADQSVDLSSFSSDILSSIDVIKTSSADQDEGSLGATVILRTVKPLSLSEPRRTMTAETRYNEYADEYDGRIAGSFSDKFLDDTLGFVITASKDDQTVRQDRLNTHWVGTTVPIVDLYAPSGRTGHDLATGKYIRILEEGQTVDDLQNWDPETQIAHDGPLDVLARNYTDISTSKDTRDRFSVSTGIQWQPQPETDIQLDVTHTKQEVVTDYHNFRLNFAPLTGVTGVDPVADWNGVNLETRTLDKSYSRRSGGFFNRTQGERELETNVASLEINHDFSDNFSMQFTAGYSKTDDETNNHVGLSTATWGTLGNLILDAIPSDVVEPVGMDCSGGSDCSYALGTQHSVFDPFDGSVSYATSAFNPFDLQANHLGSLRFRDNQQEDTNKSAHLNFNYYLDAYHITNIEFGFKYAKRNKDVYTQNTVVNTGTALIDNTDPNTSYSTVGMQSISLVDMLSGDAFPYDDFGVDLVGDRSNAFFGGWPMLDANKAIAEFAGRDPGTVGVGVNNQGTREIETETNAAYLKLNFEGFDGRLTGNIGLRYVKDKNEAMGYGGINYYRPPHLVDPHNLLVERGLGTIEGQEMCPEAVMGVNPDTGTPDTRWAPTNEDQLSGCWDWAITHGYNINNDATIPFIDGEWVLPGGMDTNRLVFGNAQDGFTLIGLPNQIYDVNGNLVDASALSHRTFNSQGYI